MKDHVWIESNGKRLSAMLQRPQGVQHPPVVIMCHGFTGEKVGGGQFNLRIANAMETAGYAVVRFDFAGSGDSEGDFAVDTTITSWKNDLREVVRWVKNQPVFQDVPVYLLGQSLGGCIVLLHEDRDQVIAGRIALAPVIYPESNFRETILGPQLWEASLAGETIANFYGKTYSLTPNLVRDMVKKKQEPLQACQTYRESVLLIHGTGDTAVSADGSRQFYEEYQGPKDILLLEGDDHGFSRCMPLVQEKVTEWLLAQSRQEMV